MGRPQQPGADSAGTLDLLILSRLARGPMHGFGIAEYLHGVSDAFHVEEGSLYPALHRLESQGLIESDWGVSENNRRARFYKLTPAGQCQDLELAANGGGGQPCDRPVGVVMGRQVWIEVRVRLAALFGR